MKPEAKPARRRACWGCGACAAPQAGSRLCAACRAAPPAWMIATPAFVAEQRGEGA